MKKKYSRKGVKKSSTKYEVLHVVSFTHTVQEAILSSKEGQKYWAELIPRYDGRRIAPEDEEYLIHLITEEQYEDFFVSRHGYCEKAGEPFRHGDPLIIRGVNTPIASGVFIGLVKNTWDYDLGKLRHSSPLTLPASSITNLIVPFEVHHA